MRPEVLGSLSSSADDEQVVRFLELHDAGVADEINVCPEQKPERRLVQRDAILVVEVEILDRQIAAIGDDDLPEGRA